MLSTVNDNMNRNRQKLIDDFLIKQCISESKKSTLNHRHGAAIMFRNKIMSISHNIAPLKFNPKTASSTHAEVSAILKFLGKHPKKMLEKCTLIVIRANNSGSLLNSKPCPNCTKFIVKHDIPTVVFSA